MQPTATDALIRLLLVEDDVHFERALTATIEASADMALCGVASTRAAGLRLIEQRQADILLVDLGLPDGSGIDVIRAAHATRPGCAIMVCTTFGDEMHVMQSIEAGAFGYLLKDSTPQKMLEEIRTLHRGGSPISPLIARQILMRFRPAPPAAEPTERPRALLSAREKEALEYITRGFTVDETAARMGLSRHTVQTYVRRIYSKLEVRSRSGAIQEAHKQGLLER